MNPILIVKLILSTHQMCTRFNSSPKSNESDKLYGINYISVLESTKNKQLVIVCGEHHGAYDSKECNYKGSYIPDYLIALGSQGVYYFDFYLENSFESYVISNDSQDDDRSSRQMDVITKYFQIPENSLKTRLHHTDVRTLRSTNFTFSLVDLLSIIAGCMSDIDNGVSPTRDEYAQIDKSIQEIYDIIWNIDSKDSNSYVKDLFGISRQGIRRNSSLKEISKIDIKFSNEKKQLMKIYEQMDLDIQNLTPNIVGLNSAIKKYIKSNNEQERLIELVEMLKYGDPIYNAILSIVTQIFDLYTLARIFHRFDLNDRDIKLGMPEYPKNVIIYAGTFHSKNINKILISLGYKQLFSSENVDKSCVDAPPLDLILDHLS